MRLYDSRTKRYIWKSTKEKNRLDAAEVALEYYEDHCAGGAPVHRTPKGRSFEHYAKLLLQQAVVAGNSSKVKDRKKILNRPRDGLISYFGEMDVAEINTGHFREYLIHLDERRDAPLANSTKQKQCLMARQVLRLAQEDGLITDIPAMPRLVLKPRPRPTFTYDEYKVLMKTMKTLALSPSDRKKTGLSMEHKNMFQFMVHTFLRPTLTELYALRHKHVEVYDDPPHLQLYVRGKTGMRVSASMPLAAVCYQSQHQKYPHATPDDYVFFPNETNRSALMNTVGRVFNRVAKHCDMKFDKWGQARTPYSFRHYALQSRLRSSKGLVNIHVLAKNAGTSVQILQDFYLKNLEISGSLLDNLQIHSMDDDYIQKRMEQGKSDPE
ncbi:MAG: integrase [Sulfitobacter sp.]|nr:integrase [Sulfitobacter sp.]